jgi:hypothetical protein
MAPPTKTMDPTKSEIKTIRPRRGSLPELKPPVEKKVPTGPRANPLYKTRLCMNFQSTGSCPYTDKCQFAHGVQELEKWETWRTTHFPDEKKDEEEEDHDPFLSPSFFPERLSRSRSQSEEGNGMMSIHSREDLKPSYLNWDLNTPSKIDNSSIATSPSTFSYWSHLIDDIENEHPLATPDRARASTHDSTYDNMSQLKDAPTLFSFPPVLPNLSKMKISLT